jgi:hypothetical protein
MFTRWSGEDDPGVAIVHVPEKSGGLGPSSRAVTTANAAKVKIRHVRRIGPPLVMLSRSWIRPRKSMESLPAQSNTHQDTRSMVQAPSMRRSWIL